MSELPTHTHEFEEQCPVCITEGIIQIFKKEIINRAPNNPSEYSGAAFYAPRVTFTSTPPHCENCKLVFHKEIDPEKISEIERKIKNPEVS